MTNGFIRYENKNGIEYASVYKAKRIGSKKTNDIEWLGRVMDKEKGVYKSRERGTFTFSFEDGIVEHEQQTAEKLILDFGDSYFLDMMLEKDGFKSILIAAFGGMADTIMSLLFYRSLQGGASYYAQDWWEGSYTRVLYPNATLSSQRVSEVLRTLGDETLQRAFFKEYLRYVAPRCGCGVLVDSTGLPNDIRFPLTAINSHGGEISNEARLVLVLDKKSGMPIYFRYAAGNIVDVSTLDTTLKEVREYGIDVQHAIVDAGYYSEKNIRALQGSGISFVMRMVSNRKKYKDLISEYADDIENAKYFVKYRDRLVYIKCVEIDLFGNPGYAYIAEDIDRKHDEVKKYVKGALDNKDISADDMNEAIRNKGLFVLVSSDAVDTKEILPLYYTRQTIEQVFDIEKNNADLLPLRVHGLEGFRGHLLLSFMASVAYLLVNKALERSDYCALGAYRVLRNLKCKVFDKKIIVQEANKKMNDIAKHVKVEYPKVLPL
jgi:hypothetical protein